MTLEAHLDVVNELLPACDPMGAFCLAFATMIGRSTGKYPPREICERFTKCRSWSEGVAIYREVMDFCNPVPKPVGSDPEKPGEAKG